MSCFTEFGPSIALTARAAARFVKTANGVLDDIDLFIRALMLDPPPASGRPRTASVERYAYRYLAAVGLSAVEPGRTLHDLVVQLRTAEEKIGLKQYPKSKRPTSLASTIRRLLVGPHRCAPGAEPRRRNFGHLALFGSGPHLA